MLPDGRHGTCLLFASRLAPFPFCAVNAEAIRNLHGDDFAFHTVRSAKWQPF